MRTSGKILVVDDSATMRMFLSMNIQKSRKGISISEAGNGRDAMEMLKKESFDLVFTDINMPEMDGLQMIERARRALKIETPIIIISALGEENNRETGLYLGANGYLTKPVKGHDLFNIIDNFMENGR